MNVVIANRQRAKKINLRLLKQIVAGFFAELKITEGELGINFVGAKEMAEVNRQFLQHEGPTDVITFDHCDVASGVKRPALHGELFVCIDEAVLQAKQFGTSWQAELVRYIVHGVLHLFGHDDLKTASRRKMKREENRLLRKLAQRFSLAQIARVSKIRT
jgi:probable rRNA maturation factor